MREGFFYTLFKKDSYFFLYFTFFAYFCTLKAKTTTEQGFSDQFGLWCCNENKSIYQ